VRGFLPLPEGSPWYSALLILAVLVQEVVRLALYLLYRRGAERLEGLARQMGCSELSVFDHMSMSLAIGLGHGFAHSVFFFLGVATLTLSPATYYIDACPHMSLFLYSALASGALLILHTFSMVVAFDGYANNIRLRKALPPAFHLAASLTTLSSLVENGCLFVVPAITVLAFIMGMYAWSIVVHCAKHSVA